MVTSTNAVLIELLMTPQFWPTLVYARVANVSELCTARTIRKKFTENTISSFELIGHRQVTVRLFIWQIIFKQKCLKFGMLESVVESATALT